MRSSRRLWEPFGVARQTQSLRRRRAPERAAGFTLVELLVTLVVLAVLLAFALPGLLAMRERRVLQGDGERALAFLQRVRFQAIERNRPFAVVADPSGRLLFVDRDGDGVFDPGERQDGVVELSRGIDFGGPPGDAAPVDGFTPSGAVRVAFFRPDGSLAAAGGFRFHDAEADDFLEVRVIEAATGVTRLRKWDGAAWRERGEGGEAWRWN